MLLAAVDAKRLLSNLRARAVRARGGLTRMIDRSKTKRISVQTLSAMEKELSLIAKEMSDVARILDDLGG